MTSDMWAITAYFNPMHWRRRRENYRRFRSELGIPLVAVEAGYDGQFDLQPGDADVLVQVPAVDVMWQKERLFNLALAAVPATCGKVACVDSDVVFLRPDVWQEVGDRLDDVRLLQCFSAVHYLPEDHPTDPATIARTVPPSPGFASLRQQGRSTLELCNPDWRNPNDLPPVSYGLAWAFRRELFAERGFYDAWVIGGGTRVHCFAAGGHWREAAQAMRFTACAAEHLRRWTEGFHRDVQDAWGCVAGAVAHLWHGTIGGRKFRQRYEDFSRFDFDPQADLALDERGLWRWNSAKPAMHSYVRDYFAGRHEDGGPPAGGAATADRRSGVSAT